MSHIVESCSLTKLNGSLSQLHSADEDAVLWLLVDDTHTRRSREAVVPLYQLHPLTGSSSSSWVVASWGIDCVLIYRLCSYLLQWVLCVMTAVANSSSEGSGPMFDNNLCKVCMDAIIDCLLLDCGHMVSCTACGKRLAECPICRQYVVRVVHVFRAWSAAASISEHQQLKLW